LRVCLLNFFERIHVYQYFFEKNGNDKLKQAERTSKNVTVVEIESDNEDTDNKSTSKRKTNRRSSVTFFMVQLFFFFSKINQIYDKAR
jgi:hypothetical protein